MRLDAVIEQLRPDYAQQAAEKKLSLSFELPPKLPVFQGDQDKLPSCYTTSWGTR